MESIILQRMQQELLTLKATHNFRQLPLLLHEGREVIVEGERKLNLSSNDYLGVATDMKLRGEFLSALTTEQFLPSSSSSRLLTGNFTVYGELEERLASLYGTEAALVFTSGYHANTGILPAVADARTLILADKLVHASIIDGIRLSTAHCIRFRHNQYAQLERLIDENYLKYEKLILVTESIFSMDGDEADLPRLVALKDKYPNVMLYLDEAHAVGVRGPKGLGCAEERNCIDKVDFLVGTFGKALASSGAFVVGRRVIRDYLINRMRTLIFTTALPPVTVQWTLFVLDRLSEFTDRRTHLAAISATLKKAFVERGYSCPSTSHIVPMEIGDSGRAVLRAEELQRKGFYALPVRPPTVPEGTSRIRFSLTADVHEDEIEALISCVARYEPNKSPDLL